MIESLENTIQIATLLVCAVIALFRAVKGKNRAWVFLVFFYGSAMLGDIYWVVYLVFFSKNPETSLVPDLSWLASYIFLYLVMRMLYPKVSEKKKTVLPWIGPVFTAGMAVFFMQYDSIVRNIIYAALEGILLFFAIKILTGGYARGKKRGFPWNIVLFCMMAYGAWTASCFWDADSLSNPYYWFDFLETVCYLFFVVTTEKAVAE